MAPSKKATQQSEPDNSTKSHDNKMRRNKTSRRSSEATADHSAVSGADSSSEPARIVLSSDGILEYVNDAFAAYFPLGQKELTGQNAMRIISILNGGHDADIANLAPGKYDIALPGFNMIRPYRFDWIERGNGDKFLVGSELDSQQSNEDASDALPEWLENALDDVRPFNSMSRDQQTQDKKTGDDPQKVIYALPPEGERRADDPWQFLNLSSEIMVVMHENGDLARANASFNRLLGYVDAELFEASLFQFIHDDDKSEARQYILALAHDDGGASAPIEFEIRMIDSNGKYHFIEWRMSHQRGVIYGVGHDRTAEKEHERALERREMELSEAQEIGRMGHWHWAVGSTEIEWSSQIYKIFGVDENEFHPTLDNVNALLHKRDVGRLLQAFQRAIIEQNTYEMDFRAICQDCPGHDNIKHIRCEGRCEMDENGEVVALFGIMQDITERVNNERVLREAKEAAERAYAAKSQFLANMSHELRTPLNAIIGFSEMMQRQLLGPIGTEKYLDYITGIRESGEHLLDLISDILDMSKIEAGKYKLDLETLNLSKIVRLAIHMMEGRAVDSGISLKADIENEDLQINADRRALMQILLNIISNAVKFTDTNGKVSVQVVEREHYLSIKIKDTGVGIPPNKLSSIIRPFEQVSNHYSRDHQGSGLGLAITKELVELHNGALSIESEVGKGTTVSVRLPYDAATKKMAVTKQ